VTRHTREADRREPRCRCRGLQVTFVLGRTECHDCCWGCGLSADRGGVCSCSYSRQGFQVE